MKGHFFHNYFLVESIIELAGPHAVVQREFRVDHKQRPRSVDAVIDWLPLNLRTAIEGQTTPARAPTHVAKARLINADVLMFVTPTSAVTRRIRAALRKAQLGDCDLKVLVMNHAQARQWVSKQRAEA